MKIPKAKLVSLASVLALLSGVAVAAEQTVMIPVEGQTMIGTLETPDTAEGPVPVVILLHGFTGSRHELPVKDAGEGVFERTARQLAENGYASLRIDFRGSGDSDGAWEDTTFSGQIADAVAAIDWLSAQDGVDGDAISVLGWSQGGLVAAHAVAARPDVDAAILWAPVSNPLMSFSAMIGADVVDKALAGAPETPHTITLPWGVETTLKGAFYHELPLTSPAAALASYPGPLLVIVGSRDTVVAP